MTTSGGVKCWGSNGYGQLGISGDSSSSTPVDVSGLESGVAQIVAGEPHTCALTTSGGVKCWGYGPFGALGNGAFGQSNTPVDVSGLTRGAARLPELGNRRGPCGSNGKRREQRLDQCGRRRVRSRLLLAAAHRTGRAYPDRAVRRHRARRPHR